MRKTILIMLFCITTRVTYGDTYKTEIKNGWFYVNGEKFLVKGVGYSPWRPGEVPWGKRQDPRVMEEDFRLIKEAGFNTIRTWAPLTEDEVLLAKKYGLQVIQGIWLDPVTDPLNTFTNPNLKKNVLAMVKKEAERFKGYRNILMFLVGNEIPAENVMQAGVKNTEDLFREIKNTINKIDKKRYVSFANWPQLQFLDHSFWDAICFNVYSYYPAIISHSLGFDGYINWLKNTFPSAKPLVITEFGYSVSQEGPGNFGYGGNSLEEHAKGCVSCWDGLIQAGAVGGCIFEWNDEWWKNYDYKKDEDSHDNQPEEWFGLLGITGTKEAPQEELRPAYYAMREYNQAIIVEPKKYVFYKKKVPIEIYATEEVKNVRFKVDESKWQSLQNISPHWWKSEWQDKGKGFLSHILSIEAFDETELLVCKKQMVFFSGKDSKNKEPGYYVSIECLDTHLCQSGEPKLVNVLFRVKDENNRPVSGIPVKYSFYETNLWAEVKGEKDTDTEGKISVDYYIREPGYVLVAGAVDYRYGDFIKTCGDIRFINVHVVAPSGG